MSHLFSASSHFDQEVCDTKVLQRLPVPDVLEFSIDNTEVQERSVSLKDLAGKLEREEERISKQKIEHIHVAAQRHGTYMNAVNFKNIDL